MVINSKIPTTSLVRDPALNPWNTFNLKELQEEKEALSSFILNSPYTHKWFVTYSFSELRRNRPEITDETIINKLIIFFSRMCNHSKHRAPIYPLLWISDWTKSLHFHCVLLHNGLTPKQHDKAFRSVFRSVLPLPKDLRKQVIKGEEFDLEQGAVFY